MENHKTESRGVAVVALVVALGFYYLGTPSQVVEPLPVPEGKIMVGQTSTFRVYIDADDNSAWKFIPDEVAE